MSDQPLPMLGIRWALTPRVGWGVFATNLAAELLRQRLAMPVPIPAEPFDGLPLDPLQARLLAPALELGRELQALRLARQDQIVTLPFPILHGLGNGLTWSPVSDQVRSEVEHGVVFLEHSPLDAGAVERGRRFRRIIAGSEWNGRVLRNAGLADVRVCPQGVDTALFRPGPRRGRFGGRFAIFSGGKLEFRKGQDLVLAAFRQFVRRHPEALLVAHWHTPYAGVGADLALSPTGCGPVPPLASGEPDIGAWLRQAGVAEDAVVPLGPIDHPALAAVLREVDAALFPNRAEGGTNLVAMECLAAGVPTVLSANTGHLDLLRDMPAWALTRQRAVAAPTLQHAIADWGESDVDEIVGTLEAIHADRAAAAERARRCVEAMVSWSWPRRARALWEAVA